MAGVSLALKQICSLVALSLAPTLVQGDQAGKLLYSQHCSACHGERGTGGVGVPLALESFQKTVGDDYLFKSIRYGRPGRVMPAFRNLSDTQIQQIVREVRGFLPGFTNTKMPVFNATSIQGNSKLGHVLFKKHCASCHGDTGKGGTGTGVTFSRPRDLPIIAPALNNAGFLRSASDAMIHATLAKGRQGTPMLPAARLGLKSKDLNDLVSYIRSFERDHQDKQQAKATDLPYIKVKSNYAFDKTLENVKRAVVGTNYRLVHTQYLNQGVVDDNKINKKQVIVYFCNFKQLNDALAIDPRIGLFLPCRLTITEEGGVVNIYAVNPARLSRLFNNSELDRACDEMTKNYKTIIEEANL